MTTTLLILMFKIACIIVLIMESGFPEEIEKLISKKLTRPFEFHLPKPFNCSLCLTFWVILITLICRDEFTIDSVLLTLLVAYSTNFISDILHLIIDGLNRIIFLIRDSFKID